MSQQVNLKSYLNQYDFKFVIPSSEETIHFKSITTGQMKKLLVYEDEGMSTVEQILDDIIVGCVTTNGFNIDKLTVQDRFQLLVEIRKKSKGKDYTFKTKCRKCGMIGPKTIDLNTLEIRPFKKDVDKRIELTESLAIDVDYIRRGVQRQAMDIVDEMKGLNQVQQLAEMGVYTYALSIQKFITPDGEFKKGDINLDDIIELLNNLDEDTYEKINSWYESTDYGVVFNTTYKCGSCEHEEVMDIPVAYFFS